MKIYDFIMTYFYQLFKRKGESDPIDSSIPYVSGFVLIHLIFLTVLVKYLLKFNFLIEYFGVKQGQGKYYSLPIVIIFFIICHFLVKLRYKKLMNQNRLENISIINLTNTIFLIGLFLFPIIFAAYLV